MASTYTDIGTELMTTGENAGNWGTKTNVNLQILEEAIRGYVAQSIAGGAQTTALTYSDGSAGDSARNAVIALTGTITGNQVVTVTAKEKWWIIDNQTSGAYTVQVLVSGQTGVTWATTDKGTKILYCNGTDVVDTGISSNKFAPDSADGESLGSSSKEFSDLYLADSGVIYFGNDQDTTLTHTDGTGLTLNSANKLLFRDSALSISSSTDGQLDIDADTEVEIATTTLDLNGALDVSGASQFSSTITVGVNDTGYDVKFFGATSGAYMLWDESTDDLVLAGAAGIDLAGDIDVDGTANLDAVDIDGAVQIDNTITVGADDQGYDVKFFGDTASAYMLWDTSADDLVLAGAAGIDLAGDIDVDGTANLDAVDIDGAVQIDNTVTVGVDDTGYDVKFFGATSGAYMLWDESTDDLVLAGAAKLYLYDAAGGEYLSSSGSALTIASGSAAWELPAADGSDGQYLKTDGSGNLDWATLSSGVSLSGSTDNTIATVTGANALAGEANLTFDGTDFLIAAAGKIQLRDTGLYVASNADGDLDIVSDGTAVDSINIESAGGITLDAGTASSGITYEDDGTAMLSIINSSSDVILTTKVQDKDLIIKGDDNGSAVTAATFDMSDAGTLILNHDLVIGDAGYIGSASDTDAIAIASDGVVTFSQTPVLSGASISAGTAPLTALDIDGATDIGEAIVDADLFIVDNGAGGTNRKVAASRIVTYIDANSSAATVGKAIAMAIVFG